MAKRGAPAEDAKRGEALHTHMVVEMEAEQGELARRLAEAAGDEGRSDGSMETHCWLEGTTTWEIASGGILATLTIMGVSAWLLPAKAMVLELMARPRRRDAWGRVKEMVEGKVDDEI